MAVLMQFQFDAASGQYFALTFLVFNLCAGAQCSFYVVSSQCTHSAVCADTLQFDLGACNEASVQVPCSQLKPRCSFSSAPMQLASKQCHCTAATMQRAIMHCSLDSELFCSVGFMWLIYGSKDSISLLIIFPIAFGVQSVISLECNWT